MFKVTPHKQHAKQQSKTTASKHPHSHGRHTTQGKGARRQTHASHENKRRVRICKLGELPESHSFQKQTRDRSCNLPLKSHFLKTTQLKHQLKIRPMQEVAINKNTRIILIDWLIEVSLEVGISKEALYQGLSYLDRLATQQKIAKSEYQPLAVGCLWLSHKIDSSMPLSYAVAQSLVDRARDEKWFIQGELSLLKKLQYRLNPFTLYQEVGMLVCGFQKYFRNQLKLLQPWPTQRNQIFWICEGVIMEGNSSRFGQSVLAVGIVLLVGRELASCGYIKQKKLLLFCVKLLNIKNLQPLERCRQELCEWTKRDCQCLQKFSPQIHHPQLRQLASK